MNKTAKTRFACVKPQKFSNITFGIFSIKYKLVIGCFAILLFTPKTIFSQEIFQKLGLINTNSQHCSPTFKALNTNLLFDAGNGLASGIEPNLFSESLGNIQLLSNINGKNFGSSNPFFIATINNKCFFSAQDSAHGMELWITDGTNAGTKRVKDIASGSSSGMYEYNCSGFGPVYNSSKSYGVLNNKLFFEGYTKNGEQLWMSDGSETGTVLLKQIDANQTFNGNSPFISDFITVGNKLFFTAVTVNAFNRELWVTDGSSSGTFLLKDIYPGSRYINNYNGPSNFIELNNKLYFTANDSVYGLELWSTDGTISGTNRVVDIHVGLNGSAPSDLFVFNNKLFFLANNGISGNEIWAYDPATNAATMIVETQTGMAGSTTLFAPTVYNNAMYFMLNSNQLWKTDGTSSGTVLVKDGLKLNSLYTKMKVFKNKIYFGSNYEIWVSDGTTTGTKALPALPSTSFDEVQPLFEINGKLVITKFNGSWGIISGKLWTCDSAQKIELIDANGVNSYGTLFEFNNAIYFEGNGDASYNLYRYGLSIKLETKNNLLKRDWKIYPNPTQSNYFSIDAESASKYDLLSSTGTVLISGNLNVGINKIQLPDFISIGMYIIKIGNSSQKIIINK